MHLLKVMGGIFTVAAVLFAADNPFLGTWKLDPDKSTFSPGEEMKDMTMSFTPEGDKIHRVASGTFTNGKPLQQGGPEGDTFAWDGKPHTMHGPPPNVVVVCTPIKHRTIHVTVTIDGKMADQMIAQVSADGNTLTETSDNTDQQGKPSHSVLVFEKQ